MESYIPIYHVRIKGPYVKSHPNREETGLALQIYYSEKLFAGFELCLMIYILQPPKEELYHHCS